MRVDGSSVTCRLASTARSTTACKEAYGGRDFAVDALGEHRPPTEKHLGQTWPYIDVSHVRLMYHDILMSWPPRTGPLPATERTSGPARLKVCKGSRVRMPVVRLCATFKHSILSPLGAACGRERIEA